MNTTRDGKQVRCGNGPRRRCAERPGRSLFLVTVAVFCVLLSSLSGMARSDERLAPGDLVRISMKEDPEVTFEGEISVAGTVPVPYLGEFQVAGHTQKSAGRNCRPSSPRNCTSRPRSP